jgi:hypothetical protein
MKTTIQAAAAAITLIASSAADAQEAVQWKVSDGGNGHWYALRLTEPGIAWATAQSSALSQGGHLATLTSAEENSLVFSIANIPAAFGGSSVVGPWLGGAREGPNWSWVTGEKWGFANWLPPNPDGPGTWGENRTCLTSSEGRWNDFNDSGVQPGLLMRSYIVEWSADCNGDGIVDYGQCRDGSLPDYNGNNIPDCCEQGGPCVVGNYPVQWRAQEGGNGHWYRLLRTADHVTWSTAKVLAESAGGHLSTLTTAEESQFAFHLVTFLNQPGPWLPGPWLGGYQLLSGQEPSGGWRWVTGETWSYANWCAGCPNDFFCSEPREEDYLHFYSPAGDWNDISDINSGCIPPVDSLMIEWSADCNSDGVVDFGQILQGQLVDADTNGIPDVCEIDQCPGDITNGGTVDATDLSIVLAAWGSSGQGEFQADIDGSGLVDGGDLALVLGGWGPCPQ